MVRVRIVKVTSKGQVTIPQELRERYGFLPDTEVEFVADGKALRIVKSRDKGGRGDRMIRQMRGRGKGKLSTDEIMLLTRG